MLLSTYDFLLQIDFLQVDFGAPMHLSIRLQASIVLNITAKLVYVLHLVRLKRRKHDLFLLTIRITFLIQKGLVVF